MKLLMEYQSGFHSIETFDNMFCSEGGKDNEINMIAVAIYGGSLCEDASDWFYHWDVKNEKEIEIVKEHYQKILNKLLELDYMTYSDFPIEGVDGDFYPDWQLN